MARWSKAKEADPTGTGVIYSDGRIVGWSATTQVGEGRGYGTPSTVKPHWQNGGLQWSDFSSIEDKLRALEGELLPGQWRDGVRKAARAWDGLRRQCYPDGKNGRRALRSEVGASSPHSWAGYELSFVYSSALTPAGRRLLAEIRGEARALDHKW